MNYPICPVCNVELHYTNVNITNRRYECRGINIFLNKYSNNHHLFSFYNKNKFSLSIDFGDNMVTVGGELDTFKFFILESNIIIPIDKFEVCDSLNIIHKILSLKTFI